MNPRFGYPKSRRITRGSEFSAVRQQGRPSHSPLFVLGVLRLAELPPSPARTGIIVSRKVGNAVVRNRTKRRLRELLRHALPTLRPGLMITLVAKRPIVTASNQEIAAEWLRLGGKAGIFAAAE